MICQYSYYSHTGEGENNYYHYQTGVAERYMLAGENTDSDVYMGCRDDVTIGELLSAVARWSFTANEGKTILFEDTQYNQVLYNENLCEIEQEYLLKSMDENIVLTEDAYWHKEDYFLFLDGETVSQVVRVDYPSKTPAVDTNRNVWFACDFDAHLEDVTFDGNYDLIISLGHAGVHGTPVSCAYVYEDGQYRYEKTFESIPTYEVDRELQVIRGRATDSASSFTNYVFEYQNGEFVRTEKKTFVYDQNGELREMTKQP